MRDLTTPDILVLDLETSGLYRKDLSIDDAGQPWAMQFAAGLFNRAGQMTNGFSHIVKSNGRMTKDKAAEVHGISARAADQVGIPERRILGCLLDMLKTAPVRGMKVVTFGDMDQLIIASLLARFALEMGELSNAYDRYWLSRPMTTFIDIQKPMLQLLCKLPSDFESGEYRWPDLDEAGQIVLGAPMRTGFHDGWDDMLRTKALYFALAERGIVEREHLEVPA